MQIKALLKDRLHGKSTGGSTEKSEPSASVELNSRNFDELVLKSKELWIVEFFAPWYGPYASDDCSRFNFPTTPSSVVTRHLKLCLDVIITMLEKC